MFRVRTFDHNDIIVYKHAVIIKFQIYNEILLHFSYNSFMAQKADLERWVADAQMDNMYLTHSRIQNVQIHALIIFTIHILYTYTYNIQLYTLLLDISYNITI